MKPQVFADATAHPRFKYFGEAGEDPYHSFLGVPLIDRGLLQGVLVVQTVEPRTFAQRRRADADDGRQRSWRRSSARRARSARSSRRRTSGCPRWRRTSGGAGTTTRPACSASSIRCCGASSDHNPVALLQQISDRKARGARRPQLALHSRINYAYRRMQEYLTLDAHLGRPPRRRAVGAAGRVLLRRVRPARVAADLLGRPRHPRRRSHQERLGSRHPARRRRPLLRPGLFQAAARSRRLAARGLSRRRQPAAADSAGDRRRRAGHGDDRDAHRHDRRRASGSWRSAAARCCCSIPTSRATSRKIAS